MAAPPAPMPAAELVQKLNLSRGAAPGDAYGAFANSYRAAGGEGAATAARPHPRMQRRPSTYFATDTGFNSFNGFLSAGWAEELKSARFRQAVVAELYATALFVAVGSLCVMYSGNEGPFGDGGAQWKRSIWGTLGGSGSTQPATALGTLVLNTGYPRIFLIAFVFGLMISILVFSTGAISGGNINPAVTASLYITGKMTALRWVSYTLAQCVGAILGAAWARGLAPDLFTAVGGAVNLKATAPWVNTWTVLGGEIMGTALLVMTVLTASDVGRERSNKYVGTLTPLVIGFAVLVSHLFLIPIDGCSINPARSFGSAVVMGNFKDHWLFWFGPMIGGPGAALLYQNTFSTGVTLAPSSAGRGGAGARDRLQERLGHLSQVSGGPGGHNGSFDTSPPQTRMGSMAEGRGSLDGDGSYTGTGPAYDGRGSYASSGGYSASGAYGGDRHNTSVDDIVRSNSNADDRPMPFTGAGLQDPETTPTVAPIEVAVQAAAAIRTSLVRLSVSPGLGTGTGSPPGNSGSGNTAGNRASVSLSAVLGQSLTQAAGGLLGGMTGVREVADEYEDEDEDEDAAHRAAFGGGGGGAMGGHGASGHGASSMGMGGTTSTTTSMGRERLSAGPMLAHAGSGLAHSPSPPMAHALAAAQAQGGGQGGYGSGVSAHPRAASGSGQGSYLGSFPQVSSGPLAVAGGAGGAGAGAYDGQGAAMGGQGQLASSVDQYGFGLSASPPPAPGLTGQGQGRRGPHI